MSLNINKSNQQYYKQALYGDDIIGFLDENELNLSYENIFIIDKVKLSNNYIHIEEYYDEKLVK